MVSGSMDHTAKLYDLNSLRVRHAFRGHVDSVNSVCCVPYTNLVLTASADKTVSAWDIRTSHCVHTF